MGATMGVGCVCGVWGGEQLQELTYMSVGRAVKWGVRWAMCVPEGMPECVTARSARSAQHCQLSAHLCLCRGTARTSSPAVPPPPPSAGTAGPLPPSARLR